MNENGKFPVVFKARPGTERQDVPCGGCVGCRLDRSKSWAARCVLESKCHSDNSFITLTFNNENLPKNRSLDVRTFQLFMKRLRKDVDKPVRYFHCGEYGGKLGRPHYHSLLFGLDFPDKVLYTVRNGNNLYRSAQLEKLWPFGFSSVGAVTYQSAAYVARYVLKKVGGDNEDHYVDKFSGEVLASEYITMSRRPGIGALWFEKYASDVYPSDQLVLDGKINKPPRYFDKLLDKLDPEMLELVKMIRSENMPTYDERSDERLAVKQECKVAQISALRREL